MAISTSKLDRMPSAIQGKNIPKFWYRCREVLFGPSPIAHIESVVGNQFRDMIDIAHRDGLIEHMGVTKARLVQGIRREAVGVDRTDVLDPVMLFLIEVVANVTDDPFGMSEPIASKQTVLPPSGLVIHSTVELFSNAAGRLVDGDLTEFGNAISIGIRKS